MKCLANVENTELKTQLLRLSTLSTPDRKCTARIMGWKDNNGNSELQGEICNNRSNDVPKEKQIIRDFMQRNAPPSSEKQYKFQHHLDNCDYILQYRLQHALHITNSASLMYLSQFTSVASTNSNSLLKNAQISEPMSQDISQPVIDNVQPDIGNSYLNGVWTIAQKYHLAPPTLSQYTNWWKFNDQGKIEQDNKIPVFGKGITPTGRNANVTKCTLRFPSESSSSAQSKKKFSENKKIPKEDQEKIKELNKLKNEDLRDATCKYFTAALEHRLNVLKQRQEEMENIDRPPSSSSNNKRPSVDISRKGNSESLEVTGKIPLFPPAVRQSHSGHRSTLPHVPPINSISVRECSDK